MVITHPSIKAQGQVPYGAKPFGHHAGVETGRQTKSLRLIQCCADGPTRRHQSNEQKKYDHPFVKYALKPSRNLQYFNIGVRYLSRQPLRSESCKEIG